MLAVVQVEGIIILHGADTGSITFGPSHGKGIGEGQGTVFAASGVEVFQPVGHVKSLLAQQADEQAVVDGEIRVGDDIQSGVQPPLKVVCQFLHVVLLAEDDIDSFVDMHH